MLERASIERLAWMGIDVWVLRGREAADAPQASRNPERAAESAPARWLLLVDPVERDRYPELLADLQALFGPASATVVPMADAASAGLTDTGGSARPGAAGLLCFGVPAPHIEGAALVEAPRLDVLAVDADARQALWRALRPHLEP
ncbi:MAG: hypothetical protein Kow0020_06100 [Wenzhouxiangellaceae bacterium]